MPLRRAISSGASSIVSRRAGGGSAVKDTHGSFDEWLLSEKLKVTDATTRIVRKFRHGSHTHVSDLLYKCMRAMALSMRAKIAMPSSLQTHAEGVCFAQGDAIQEYVTSVFLTQFSDPAKETALFGDWSCICGSTVERATRMPKNTCTVCQQPVNRYIGMRFTDDSLLLEGNADIVLAHGKHNQLRMIECKSMAGHAWAALNRPLPDHVIQNALYERLASRRNLPTSKMLGFVYVNKDYTRDSPFKVFDVTASDYSSRVDSYVEQASQLANYIKNKSVLPCRICKNREEGMRKKCHVVTLCFTLRDKNE